MQKFRMTVLALLASWAVGCISVDSVVKVKADGTGTIEQTMLVNGSAMGMMSMMGGPQGGDDKAAPKLDPATIFSNDKLAAEAANLGEGVSFVSSTPVTQGEMKGVKAIYAFKDFNTLKVSTALPDLNDGNTQMKGKGAPLPMTLSRKGGNALITLNLLDQMKKTPTGSPSAKSGDTPEMPKEMMAMLAPMFKDMRVAIALEPQGTLVRTNATHVQGQRITLFDVAFGEIFADPTGVEKLEKLGNNPSIDQIRSVLKGMKGIKINEAEKLEVEFK